MATANDSSPPTDPESVSWTAPDLRSHLPDESELPSRGLEAAIAFLRNPDASGAFIAAELHLSRRPEPVRETLRALLAYPLDARQPRDSRHPSDADFSTGVTSIAGESAETFAGLSPKQRGVAEVAAHDGEVLARADDPNANLPASDICRRAESLGFEKPHDSYPNRVLTDYRTIVDDRRAVLAARGGVDDADTLAERLDDVMDPATDTPARALLAAAGWFLPDHNLDAVPPADQSSEADLHPDPDEDEADERAVSLKTAAAAGSPVPWTPDAIAANDPRIESEGAAPLGDLHPTAIPAPWPLVRSVLAPSGTTNRTVRAGIPYVAVVNGVREGFGMFVNLDSDVYDVNGLVRANTMPEAASEQDFTQGDRVTVYLRRRKKADAEDPRDVDLEFVLAPRTVAERYSPGAAEEYATAHTDVLPGEGPDESTPAPSPDPEDGLKADPSEMLLEPPEGGGRPLTLGGHARSQYASRARPPDGEKPSLEDAWSAAEPVDPEPFARTDGDGSVPDAVRYHPETNVSIVRRDNTLVTVLGGFGHTVAETQAVRALGYDPKPGDTDVSVPSADGSVRPAICPVLAESLRTETAAITDSRARDPPGFISEWPAPDPRPTPADTETTPAIRVAPRPRSATDLTPAVRVASPSPRPGPADTETVAAIRPLSRSQGSDENDLQGGDENDPIADRLASVEEALQALAGPADADVGMRSFEQVRAELARMEAAGHEVTGVCIETTDDGATLTVNTTADAGGDADE
jgi:hypothetical protein